MSGGYGGVQKRRRFRKARRFGRRRFRYGRKRMSRMRMRRSRYRSAYRNKNGYTLVRKKAFEVISFGNDPLGPPKLMYAWEFKMSDIPNAMGISTYFEEYRIKKIYATIEPKMPVPVAIIKENAGNYQNWPKFIVAVDYDDVDLIATSANPYEILKQRTGVQYGSFDRKKAVKMKFTPRVLVPNYRTGVNWSYSTAGGRWIRCRDYDCPHYGLKAAVENWGIGDLYWGTDNMTFDVQFTYVIEFRFPKSSDEN